MKNQGNAFLNQNELQSAIGCYTEAILLDPSNHILYSNRSTAYLKIGNYNLSLADAEKVIQLDSQWPRGYSRKALALYYLDRFQEAHDACQMALSLDPGNSLYKSYMDLIIEAQRVQKLPSGIWCPLPLPYSNKSIPWDLYKDICDWMINKGCAGIVPLGGPAVDLPNMVEILKNVKTFTKDRCWHMCYLNRSTSIQKDIETLVEAGAQAVVVPVNLLMTKSTLDEEDVLNQVKLLFEPFYKQQFYLGIADTKDYALTPSLLSKLVNLKIFRFYIDLSDALSIKRVKYQAIGGKNPGFKIYNGNLTTLLNSLQMGYHGYIGEAGAYYPEILNWLFNHKDETTWQRHAQICQCFFTLTELIIERNFPLNVLMFWKIHVEEFGDKVELESHQTDISIHEVDVLRLSHLSDLVKYAWESLKEEKDKDKSVLL